MLTCVPRSLCSWNFVVRDPSDVGAIEFNFFSEQGTIHYGPSQFEVRKHGWLSGRWTLEDGSQTLLEAVKPNAFFRRFEVRDAVDSYLLSAGSPLGRSFELSSGGRTVGQLYPAHAFTRRAFIDCAASVPEITQIFCFWLVALTWKRSQNNNNHPG
jgi:hypothetical protein